MSARGTAEGNIEIRGKKIKSLSDSLYSTKRKTCKGKSNSNGSRWSTFVGHSALLPLHVIDFAMLPAQRRLAGNSFIVSSHVISK